MTADANVLDHLIYALSTRRCSQPSDDDVRQVEFLIRKSKRDFECDWRVKGGLFERLIGSDALAAMELSQPYQRDSLAPMSDPMWILREMDNIDKHRTVVVLALDASRQFLLGRTGATST